MSRSRSQTRQTWDAVIIGAGPAGCSAALGLADAGCRVLILERRHKVGVPVHCAEYVPRPLLQEVSLPESAVARRVDRLRTYIQGKLVAENQWPGVVLNRALFDQSLARRAMGHGARLLTGCRVEGVENDTVFFRKDGRWQGVRGRVVVGADGPLSTVGRSLGLRNQAFVYGLQLEAPLAISMDHTEAHFWQEFVGGYGWVFPKGAWVNVGVGVTRRAAPELPRLLGAFLADLRERGVVGAGPPRERTGGLIPIGGPPARTVQDGVLLVGDAAGQTDPITGSGIPAACSCGQAAGQAVLDALAADEPHRIRDYEERWRAVLGNPLDRALRRRNTQEREWETGPFERLIRRTWIAFPEYFRDR